MSYITHICRRCGHGREAHEPQTRSCLGYTSCGCRNPDYDPTPVIRDTFRLPGAGPSFPPVSERLEPLTEPGAAIYAFPTVRSCDCDECRTAYAQNVDRYPKGA